MQPINLKEDVQPLSEFRSGVSSFIQQVTETKRPLLITQHGKGVAILTDVEEFENLTARLDLLESIYKAEAQINDGKGISHDDAKSIVLKSIKT
ncbi:MAG TPA: type II toxin-antitoxin system Phd/YefM family antitoxin [Gammaproteobacteria bacterium]|nr:type II toxin-antitoxin system Phd/YefM family antitoxin [Gammaproteobacteria bacterium]